MAIVTVMLKKHHQKKNGTYPVVIRVAHNGKKKYVYTGCSVFERDWDEKKSLVKSTCKDYRRFNALIEDKRAEIMSQITTAELNNKEIDLKFLEDPPTNGSFSAFIQKRIEYFEGKENINMVYKCKADKREIEEVNLGKEVYYSDLSIKFLQQLELKIRKNNNSQNTVARKFKNYRTHYEKAILEDGAPFPNPFKLVKFRKEPVKRYKLNKDETTVLENLQLPQDSQLEVARDMFLFSFYCQGMRFENCLTLKKEQIINAKIHYQMNKGKKHRTIGFHPQLEALVNKYLQSHNSRYLFPLLNDREYSKKELYHVKGSWNA